MNLEMKAMYLVGTEIDVLHGEKGQIDMTYFKGKIISTQNNLENN